VYEDALIQEVAAHLPIPLDANYNNLSQNEIEEVNKLQADVEEFDEQIEDLQEQKRNAKHLMNEILGLIDEETGETIRTLQDIKDELKEKVVKDGLFVFQQVQDFAVSVADKNSSNISEAISIANAEALANAEKNKGADDMLKYVIMLVFGLAGLAIVYKIVTGT
jgi:seryl-tRNA synthetase